MKSQVLHTGQCNISGEAAGEIWDWSLLGVKGLKEDKSAPFVWFSTLQWRRFGRESVSYSETNWQDSFDLIATIRRLIGLRGTEPSFSRRLFLFQARLPLRDTPHPGREVRPSSAPRTNPGTLANWTRVSPSRTTRVHRYRAAVTPAPCTGPRSTSRVLFATPEHVPCTWWFRREKSATVAGRASTMVSWWWASTRRVTRTSSAWTEGHASWSRTGVSCVGFMATVARCLVLLMWMTRRCRASSAACDAGTAQVEEL